MTIEQKLDVLNRIYGIYDAFARGLDVACRKYCAHCCTSNVSLTTLEGYRLVHSREPDQLEHLQQCLEPAFEKRVFRPLLTTNRIAELCRQGREIPEEAFGDPAEICPLLEENACPVYSLRPFGCRCLVSRVPCRESGTAEMPDFVLTVNTVFLQMIEHLDATGCTGNLADVLLCLLSAENRHAYEEGRLSCNATGLIGNHPLTVLMVPPEHRNRLQPILGALAKLSTEPSSAL
jgi:Fe-S-cluster containining protein